MGTEPINYLIGKIFCDAFTIITRRKLPPISVLALQKETNNDDKAVLADIGLFRTNGFHLLVFNISIHELYPVMLDGCGGCCSQSKVTRGERPNSP